MANKHMNLKRIIHRSGEELIATGQIAKATSLLEAITTFWAKIDIQIMNRNGYHETPNIKRRLIKKHDIILRFVEEKYEDFLASYDFSKSVEKVKDEYRNKIWVCWWQGLESAPAIVKRCVESIKRNAGEYEVIIITEENYKKYSQLPDWLERKKEMGIISRTHYSDVLRMDLLARHGGVWIDSTFFCVDTPFSEYFQCPVWSIKRPDYLHCSIAGGYFANYSLGCTYENRWVYAIIRDFLLYYWAENDMIVDYLLTDYLIVLAEKYDEEFAKKIEEIPSNNPCCDELFKILGDPFDENVWKDLREKTFLFKLSWKHQFPTEKKGMKTFYGKLMDDELH